MLFIQLVRYAYLIKVPGLSVGDNFKIYNGSPADMISAARIF